MINAQPYVLRHLAITTVFSTLYMIVNFAATKIWHKPVYSTMDWDSLWGILTPILFLVFSPVMVLIAGAFNNLKLWLAGHKRIVAISRGKVDDDL